MVPVVFGMLRVQLMLGPVRMFLLAALMVGAMMVVPMLAVHVLVAVVPFSVMRILWHVGVGRGWSRGRSTAARRGAAGHW